MSSARMDARTPIEVEEADIVYSVAFNNTNSHFAVGSNTGYRVYTAKTCQEEVRREGKNNGLANVQMMGTSQVLGLVGGGSHPMVSPHKVILYDDDQSRRLREMTCLEPVRGLKLLTTKKVVVMLKNEVRIYLIIANGSELLSTYPTADNSYGLCCATTDEKLIAFPGRTKGQVHIMELEPDSGVSIIPAHSAPLRAIAFGKDGKLLATASEHGTLIRVWSTTTNSKLAELRRGVDPATIFSIGFSPSGALLACTSDKGTLHIYDVPHTAQLEASSPSAETPKPAAGSGDSDAGSTVENKSVPDSSKGGGNNKWGLLAKIPMLPQYFRDVTSFATAEFAVEDPPEARNMIETEAKTMGVMQLPKGIIGWIHEDTLIVVGAGVDARYEKFIITNGKDGTRACVRKGWMKYLQD